ncbi:MAG: hypothetical protein MI749_18050 [Desulfovibrionales bacterium]|nr:hypothetical protein [Desulfovibrionales bacterium]
MILRMAGQGSAVWYTQGALFEQTVICVPEDSLCHSRALLWLGQFISPVGSRSVSLVSTTGKADTEHYELVVHVGCSHWVQELFYGG